MPAFKKLKGNGGRKLKLTDKKIEEVCKVLKSGVFVETAVVMCDIGKKTFYEWIKDSHRAEKELEKENKRRKKAKLKAAKLSADDALRVKFRNAVAKAMEEATIRDVINIDKSAMGRKPVYDRYPPNTKIPARDDKGKVQVGADGEPIYIDVSNQIICDYKGKPIIADHGAPPDWRASAWRLEKRVPKDWGQVSTVKMERVDPLEAEAHEDDDINIVFVNPDENPEDL